MFGEYIGYTPFMCTLTDLVLMLLLCSHRKLWENIYFFLPFDPFNKLTLLTFFVAFRIGNVARCFCCLLIRYSQEYLHCEYSEITIETTKQIIMVNKMTKWQICWCMYVSFTYVVSLLCQCVCISADDAILFVTFSFYCEMLLCMLALCHCLSTAAAKFRYVKECFFFQRSTNQFRFEHIEWFS